MSDFPRTAFLLGAGLGTRLRPLTENCPKPLLPIGGRPMVVQAMEKLHAAGTRRFIINTHHCPEAWALGLAGLLPFVLGGAGVWFFHFEWSDLAATALLTYAAVIVSFLGGIHWGMAMRQTRAPRGWLIWGVLPSLLAWAGLLLNSAWGLLLMAASLILCYVVDAQIYRPLQLGAWLILRGMLTFVAVVSCLAGAAAFWG